MTLEVKSYLLCSFSSPSSLILLASCCAFFLSRQIRDASMFFSRPFAFLWFRLSFKSFDLNTSSIPLILLPIWSNFNGSGRRSFPTPWLALLRLLVLLTTFCVESNGSSMQPLRMWKSPSSSAGRSRLAFGPRDSWLYCQKEDCLQRMPYDRNCSANVRLFSSDSERTEHQKRTLTHKRTSFNGENLLKDHRIKETKLGIEGIQIGQQSSRQHMWCMNPKANCHSQWQQIVGGWIFTEKSLTWRAYDELIK